MNSDFNGGFERLLWGIDLNAGSSRSTSHTSPKSLHKEAGNLQAEITQLVRELLQVLADLEVGRTGGGSLRRVAVFGSGDDSPGSDYRQCRCRKRSRCRRFIPKAKC
jgi:hypothetical protein